MAGKMIKNVIEVPLRKVSFSNGRSVVMSLLAEDLDIGQRLRWAVAVFGDSSNPVLFYNNNADALEEYVKRCGQAVSGGSSVIDNEVYGSVSGYYGPARPTAPVQEVVARGPGWRAVRRGVPDAVRTPTLKIKNERQ